MAAAVYLRVTSVNQKTTVTLICSKTRVAPLKKITIPRLELNAALLLSRLEIHVQRALELTEIPIHLWTDSSVTLTWITSHPSRWKDYVRNRVTMIQDLVPSSCWRFVPGKENPADCASRGLRVDQLFRHSLWWKGPPWLIQPTSQWPVSNHKSAFTDELEERSGLLHTVSIRTKPTYWDLLDRHSSLIRLLRITSICRRVVSRLRKSENILLNIPLTPQELQQSIQFWIKIIQEGWFGKEIKQIACGTHLSKSNPLIRLTAVLDKQGLLRVGGRLQNSNLDFDTKHPLILPRESPLTQATFAYIRQNYWI